MLFPRYETLDDLLNSTYKAILENGENLSGKRGHIKEIRNFAVTLNNPRSRTSRSLDRRLVRSKFAEFAWYCSKDSDKNYINPYIGAYNLEEEENHKILGAYGPKIFGAKEKSESQFERIINQINARKYTKQAFLVISESKDYKLRFDTHSSPPCTIGLHFLVRYGKLHLTVYMRSNDAYFGLPHDLFSFSMIQELVSYFVNIPLGDYTHICSSMHIYEKHLIRVEKYLQEGFQEGIVMPKMTSCSQEILELVSLAFDTIKQDEYDFDNIDFDNYWKDFILFSNEVYNEISNKENWIAMFKTEEFREIASCSITK